MPSRTPSDDGAGEAPAKPVSCFPPLPPRADGALRIALLGDVVGGAGRRAVAAAVPLLREAGTVFVVANGENASGGLGLAIKESRSLLARGVDVLTNGNHVWKHKELLETLAAEPRVLRPLNMPPGTPGNGRGVFPAARAPSPEEPRPSAPDAMVVCLIGRTFMGAADCPFRAIDAVLAEPHPPIVIVDFHAEATAEKLAMRYHLDGRASVVAGTHTHVQTSDATVTAAGTGYVTDLGMCGVGDSVIGFEPKSTLQRFLTLRPHAYLPAKGPGRAEGVVADIDPATGRCLGIAAFRIG